MQFPNRQKRGHDELRHDLFAIFLINIIKFLTFKINFSSFKINFRLFLNDSVHIILSINAFVNSIIKKI